jgi:hypothetical protein
MAGELTAWFNADHLRKITVRLEPSKPRIREARREQETVCIAKSFRFGYDRRNAKPAKTEIALVLRARPLSMVLDNVGDIGEPCMASRLRE